MSQALEEYEFVADESGLREIADRVRNTEIVALDTEFIRERTYYPELCVLQIATDEFIAAIDCLADIDLAPLYAALVGGDKAWLLHSARQDLEILLDRTERHPDRLIDTQIAAALLGANLQIGLQGLLQEFLDVSIGKEHTRTDWTRRPLPVEAIGYAIDDVRYLLPAWRELAARLDAAGRRTWFEEDCARQLGLPTVPEATTILERTRGAGSLTGQHRAAALALVVWREDEAKRKNRPRRWILADEAVARIAAAAPASLADLKTVRDLPRRLIEHSGSSIVAALAAAQPAVADEERVTANKALVDSLRASVKAQAKQLGIQPELLATRREITLAAAGKPPETLCAGWRSEILGDLLAGSA